MAFFTRRPKDEDEDFTLFLVEDQPEEPKTSEDINTPQKFFDDQPEATIDEPAAIEQPEATPIVVEPTVSEATIVEPIGTDWHDTIESFAEPAEDSEEETTEADSADGGPQHAAKKRSFGQWMLDIFVPLKGDEVLTILRKALTILCAISLLVALGWLFNDTWLVSVKNEKLSEDLARLYDPTVDKEFSAEVEEYDGYPEGMDPAFRALYYSNNDVRGWITYTSSSKEWYGINYPIVQAADNDKYLYRDFYGEKNKNGTLFFDCRNSIAQSGNDQSTIIYGHNMLSGQMFASLNKLLYNVGMARSAPTLSMNTLYQQANYKVFAVFIWDNQNPGGFNYMRTTFSSDEDFLEYVAEVRMRSWYDYNDVSVEPGDELLVLSTCSNTSQTHLSDGRTVVVARKVREGETSAVNTALTVVNEDVLQPIAWYKAEKLPVPSYYDDEQGNHNTTGTTTGTTTKPNGGKDDPSVLKLNLQCDEGVSGYSVSVNGQPYDEVNNPIRPASLVEITIILNPGYKVVSWNGQASDQITYSIPNVQKDIELVVDTEGSPTDKTTGTTTTPTGKPTNTTTTTTTGTGGDSSETTTPPSESTGSSDDSSATSSSTDPSTESTDPSTESSTSTSESTEENTSTTDDDAQLSEDDE